MIPIFNYLNIYPILFIVVFVISPIQFVKAFTHYTIRAESLLILQNVGLIKIYEPPGQMAE